MGYLGKERMQESRNHQPHQVSLTRHERAGREVWPIVEFPHPVEHPLTSLDADVVVIPQDLGNGYQRNAEIICDILHPDDHGLNYPRRLDKNLLYIYFND